MRQNFFPPPCLLPDPPMANLQLPSEVARWRRAARLRLRAERDALGVEERRVTGAALTAHLRSLLEAVPGMRVLASYWPIKGEPDLRPLLSELHAAGLIIALPVVETRAAPLVFRRWTPGMPMVRGDWNIPVPPPDADRLMPDTALAPVVGWDAAGFRLGYGGGYFDRTLAVLAPRPFAIGVGSQSARLSTIFPQPHDIAMNAIVTEAGVQIASQAS